MCRASMTCGEIDVDGRNKSGHDEMKKETEQ